MAKMKRCELRYSDATEKNDIISILTINDDALIRIRCITCLEPARFKQFSSKVCREEEGNRLE